MGLFGNTKNANPKEQLKEWTTKLRKEGRQLDRQILAIHREEDKVKRSMKDAAKKGQKEVCLTLAKELLESRKAVKRIYSANAHIKSVGHSLKQQAAVVRLSGVIQKSTQVMVSMQRLVNVSEISATMRDLSKEMMRAGIMEEMLEDTMEGLADDEDLEEDAQKEVDNILWEITAGKLGEAPAAGKGTLPAEGATAAVEVEEEEEEEEDEEAVNEMQARLEALRS